MCENCGKCGCGAKSEKESSNSKIMIEHEKYADEKKKDHSKNFSFVEI